MITMRITATVVAHHIQEEQEERHIRAVAVFQCQASTSSHHRTVNSQTIRDIHSSQASHQVQTMALTTHHPLIIHRVIPHPSRDTDHHSRVIHHKASPDIRSQHIRHRHLTTIRSNMDLQIFQSSPIITNRRCILKTTRTTTTNIRRHLMQVVIYIQI